MKKEERLHSFVTAVCAMLAALLLVSALLCEVHMQSMQNETEALEREKTELEREERILTARLAGRLDMEQIERYAEEILGMQRCRPDQIVILPSAG